MKKPTLKILMSCINTYSSVYNIIIYNVNNLIHVKTNLHTICHVTAALYFCYGNCTFAGILNIGCNLEVPPK